MADDLKKMYRTVMDDNFPPEITISFGDQTLVYRKRSWKIPDAQTGETIEKGLRYGENPGQEAALYELINGNLALADCKFIEGGKGLVSSVTEEDMIQSGKHPGKTNLTDIDNSLNVLKYLTCLMRIVVLGLLMVRMILGLKISMNGLKMMLLLLMSRFILKMIVI